MVRLEMYSPRTNQAAFNRQPKAFVIFRVDDQKLQIMTTPRYHPQQPFPMCAHKIRQRSIGPPWVIIENQSAIVCAQPFFDRSLELFVDEPQAKFVTKTCPVEDLVDQPLIIEYRAHAKTKRIHLRLSV